jgi:hypothetical protein
LNSSPSSFSFIPPGMGIPGILSTGLISPLHTCVHSRVGRLEALCILNTLRLSTCYYFMFCPNSFMLTALWLKFS